MTDTLAQALSSPFLSLRLWHPLSLKLIWPTTGLTVPKSYQEVLAANAPWWVFATLDEAGPDRVITMTDGHHRVWAGELRIATHNDPWAEVEWRGTDPLVAIRNRIYGDLADSYEANPPRAEEIAGPIEVDPWSDGWKPGQWWRVVLTDGTVWSESSDHGENVAKLRAIRGNEVTVYPPGHPDGKRYGPDPGAQLQRRFERAEHTWRDEELAGE
ncbi:hypothetical protein [Mycolicibacterium nivoides]|uniref:Uncharacterized protein n=1 Tax=Mycolicibacterium nivoides TaxID=2487344 RepID=A0ABW9L6G1_9MYCO